MLQISTHYLHQFLHDHMVHIKDKTFTPKLIASHLMTKISIKITRSMYFKHLMVRLSKKVANVHRNTRLAIGGFSQLCICFSGKLLVHLGSSSRSTGGIFRGKWVQSTRKNVMYTDVTPCKTLRKELKISIRVLIQVGRCDFRK